MSKPIFNDAGEEAFSAWFEKFKLAANPGSGEVIIDGISYGFCPESEKDMQVVNDVYQKNPKLVWTEYETCSGLAIKAGLISDDSVTYHYVSSVPAVGDECFTILEFEENVAA